MPLETLMTILTVALLIVLGFLGAVQLLAARKPEVKKIADALAPYQGWIGVAGFAFGAYFLIRLLLNQWFTLLEFAPLTAIVAMAAALLLIVLGAMYGISIFRQFAGEEKAAKVDGLLARVRPIQGGMGLAAMAVGVLVLIL